MMSRMTSKRARAQPGALSGGYPFKFATTRTSHGTRRVRCVVPHPVLISVGVKDDWPLAKPCFQTISVEFRLLLAHAFDTVRYREPRQGGNWEADAGLRVRSPLDPFVKGSYRFLRGSSEHTLYNFRETVTWQMAALLVALPIYLIVMRQIVRETRANPERIESGVRKWLTYIALFLAAVAVVSDLVVFVDYFLKGELTLRFVLKCVVVLLTCGSIFWYYIGFLRGQSGGIVYTT